MQAHVIPGVDEAELLDPLHALWRRADVSRIALSGTPLGLQPSPYVQAAWRDRRVGATGHVRVAALHDGVRLAFRLEWEDASRDAVLTDDDRFADAAAVMLPAAAEAPIYTMGAPGLPVTAWYWRADEQQAREIVAEGIGSSRTVARDTVRAAGVWQAGRWSVVVARSLAAGGPGAVQGLGAGAAISFGVAIWEGGSGERAGLKSWSGPAWQSLTLEPAPTARS